MTRQCGRLSWLSSSPAGSVKLQLIGKVLSMHLHVSLYAPLCISVLRTQVLIPQLCPLQFTFLQDDLGIPLNYRHMEGFGVHTYTLISREGKVRVSACSSAPFHSMLAVCWPSAEAAGMSGTEVSAAV